MLYGLDENKIDASHHLPRAYKVRNIDEQIDTNHKREISKKAITWLIKYGDWQMVEEGIDYAIQIGIETLYQAINGDNLTTVWFQHAVATFNWNE